MQEKIRKIAKRYKKNKEFGMLFISKSRNENIYFSFAFQRDSTGLNYLYMVVFALQKRKKENPAMRTNDTMTYRIKLISQALNLEFR